MASGPAVVPSTERMHSPDVSTAYCGHGDAGGTTKPRKVACEFSKQSLVPRKGMTVRHPYLTDPALLLFSYLFSLCL